MFRVIADTSLESSDDEEGDSDPHLPSTRPYLQVHNPSFDHVPPKLISMFLTGEWWAEVGMMGIAARMLVATRSDGVNRCVSHARLRGCQ